MTEKSVSKTCLSLLISAIGFQAAPAALAEDTPGWRSFVRPPDEALRSQLTEEQFEVARREATEAPFKNPYWDNHEPGIYVDIVSGEPLFSSLDKFDSGSGWPSFDKPLLGDTVVQKADSSLGMTRTEVRSKRGDSHLGHLFDDGPTSTGMRYCINSASLRFIPAKDLEKEGYGEFATRFKNADKAKD